MIEKCVTANTPIFTIEFEEFPKLSEDTYDYYDKLAQKMSNEMGVPKELLFVRPHFFFIDHWHKINGRWYFYKSDGYDFHFINELLGEVISEYFELDTVHYKVGLLKLGKNEKRYGLISENFCSPNYLYTRTWDYNLGRKNIFELDRISEICDTKEETTKLLSDMKKFIISDFYTSQADRHGNNFLFSEKKDRSEGKRLAPLYDYENSFESSDLEIYGNQILYLNMNDPDLRKFFEKDTEYQEILSKIRDANMTEFLRIVEGRHNIIIPKEYKDYYIKIDKIKKEIIKTNQLIKVLTPKR